MNLEIIYQKIGYRFKTPSLLEAALIHRSVQEANNERLEFLGDSIINFIIADTVYARCPEAREGDLSRLRSYLVRGEMLAAIAQELDLGEYLKLGGGELKSGGYRRKSILADAMEAVIAAIYLDAGIEVCREHVLRWFEHRIEQAHHSKVPKDPKTRLQEYVQARKIALPVYKVMSVEGEAHRQLFRVSCRIRGQVHMVEGTGPNRRTAEQDAARKFLELLENE